jgi:hypothetical protein
LGSSFGISTRTDENDGVADVPAIAKTVFPVFIDHFFWEHYEMIKDSRHFQIDNSKISLYIIIYK